MPINVYNVVHTGEKIQLGGLKDGFTSKPYQGERLLAVKNPPIIPGKKQTNIKPISFKKFFIISPYYETF
jgi:hypothetical protein